MLKYTKLSYFVEKSYQYKFDEYFHEISSDNMKLIISQEIRKKKTQENMSKQFVTFIFYPSKPLLVFTCNDACQFLGLTLHHVRASLFFSSLLAGPKVYINQNNVWEIPSASDPLTVFYQFIRENLIESRSWTVLQWDHFLWAYLIWYCLLFRGCTRCYALIESILKLGINYEYISNTWGFQCSTNIMFLIPSHLMKPESRRGAIDQKKSVFIQ